MKVAILMQSKSKDLKLSYGTAGFRDKAKILENCFIRVGALAYLRSLKCNMESVGVMITASHNGIDDNGVKIIDPDGGMLEQSWERYAEDFINTEDPQDVWMKICKEQNINTTKNHGMVIIGYDTRPHSIQLASLTEQGVLAVGGQAKNVGLCTTPELHHIIRFKEMVNYDDMMIDSFTRMIEVVATTAQTKRKLFVDCANGVGGSKFQKLLNRLTSSSFEVELYNVDDITQLNDHVGAEHVQKTQTPPRNTPSTESLCASLDGDADRVVFFTATNKSSFQLFDGDKIAILFADFIQKEIIKLGLQDKLTLGVVQTAYANGASTKYLETQGIKTVLAKTGVKYLHALAHHYDIGIYFEANGHGTVLFSEKFQSIVPKDSVLMNLSKLLNQATGDAIADLLAVEAILMITNQTSKDWASMYTDLPSRQLKVKVQDRNMVKTIDDESRLLSPIELQETIDELCSLKLKSRAFVRPSGTENVVRVYAEASTSEDADQLAEEIAKAVEEYTTSKRPRNN